MSDSKVQPKILPGFMELLPGDQILFNQLVQKIRRSYENFGFVPLDTPIIELSEILLAKGGGATERQVYRFNKGESDLTLRFDLTVPLARYVSQYFDDLQFPFRRYQIGKVYRGEKPQKGRFREFYQCDIDIIGNGSLGLLNDAEIPAAIYSTFKNLGLGNFLIRINNRKVLTGLAEYLGVKDKANEVLGSIDKIEKIGSEGVKKELEKLAIPQEKITTIIEFTGIKGDTKKVIQELKNLSISNEHFLTGVKELEVVSKYIKALGVPNKNWCIDLSIARGLDYYTGTVYETILTDYPEIGSVCSGGRFDNLAEFYTDRKLPGVGVSIGLTRLFYQLREANIIKPETYTNTKVLVLPLTDNLTTPFEIASKLRDGNIPTEVYLETEAGFREKFAYGRNLGINYIIIIGEEEIKNSSITVKDMVKRTQESYSLKDLSVLIDKIKNH